MSEQTDTDLVADLDSHRCANEKKATKHSLPSTTGPLFLFLNRIKFAPLPLRTVCIRELEIQ